MRNKVYIDEDFIRHHCKRFNITEQIYREKTDEFINEALWDYSFENEYCRPRVHSEASALSQMLFLRLMRVPFECADINFMSKIKVDGIEVSFDIMNNPNSFDKNFYRLGNRAKRNNIERLDDWKKIKYTIGNFTPIPNSNGMRHLQLIHNDKSERWDYLLEYLKDNWDNYSPEDKVFHNFVDYMIKTVQHIYFEKIFIDIKDKLQNRKINQVEDEEWLKWLEGWNDILKEKNDDLKLISFGPKTKEEGNIDAIIEDICLLIEIRGRLIMTLLRTERKVF